MPADTIEMVGKTFGRLTVMSRTANGPDGGYKWRCKCRCGETVIMGGVNLRRLPFPSCAKCRKLPKQESV